MIRFTLNDRPVSTEATVDTPLLWVVRDDLGFTGTKYGCGKGLCGACTVHLEGQPIRSCVTPIAAVQDKRVTTIEGLTGKPGHAVQAAWERLNVPQCGYCQSGQMMSAAGLLARNPQPSDADIDHAMAGNICRCATYVRIRAAIHEAASALAKAERS